MRRLLSICLLLFFAIGPLSAAFQSNEDLRLPACCRRHGAHHCSMPDSAHIAAASTDGPILFATPHCPEFPRTGFAVDASQHAFLVATSSLASLLASEHTPAAARASARASQLRTRADRGPPTSRLA